jgi:SAM-dependent methyltransferase
MPGGAYPELRWTPPMIARFWDWQSQYPETYFTYIFGGEIARSLKRYLVGRETVLDLGCGVGYLLPHLCRYARCVYGADVSHESIARVNARLSGTKAFAGAVTPSQLRAQQTRFDSIFVVEVIEHLYDEALDALMTDVRNLLAPDGVVIFTTPNDEVLERNMILCPQTGEVFHRWQHVRNWNKGSLAKWLGDGGFEPVEIVETNFALARPLTPVELAKRIVNRILLGRPGKPHLVGVAKLAKASGR